MLTSLKINDIAIIEEAKIEYDSGLNIMTGETGSGKSIVIDSINAVLGERTSKELIRHGAGEARVSAVFENIGDGAAAVLNEYGIPCDDRSLFIQRTIREGRNVCKINGENVAVSVLKAVGKHLINIHGQHDSQALFNSENHINYIDLWAGNRTVFDNYSEKFNRLKKINRELKKLSIDENQKQRRIEELKYHISEIENAGIRSGEKEKLLTARKRQQNFEKLRGLLNSSKQLLDGDDDIPGIVSRLFELNDFLGGLSEYYPEAAEYISSASESLDILEDCSSFISEQAELLDDGGVDINRIEERLDIIYRMTKKYGADEDEVLKYLDEAKKELNEIELSGERVGELTAEYNRVLEELISAGNELTKSRIKAGEDFSRRIMQELSFLDMPNVVFKTDVKQCAATSKGLDAVEFLISANLGQEPRPLAKIASGGELSRIMLAIKCVLSDLDDTDTLIFDEIDTGVSGRAAEKIGSKLKEVSKYSQVICVTHLAQIACFADNHLFIEKRTDGARTFTNIRKLDFEERKHEIARIIGGSFITSATLASAEEMLLRRQ